MCLGSVLSLYLFCFMFGAGQGNEGHAQELALPLNHVTALPPQESSDLSKLEIITRKTGARVLTPDKQNCVFKKQDIWAQCHGSEDKGASGKPDDLSVIRSPFSDSHECAMA